MSIKGFKDDEVVSVYDPTVQAYREVLIVDLEEQMSSLGMTKSEIKTNIKKLKERKS